MTARTPWKRSPSWSNEAFARWADSAYGERPSDYEAFKEAMKQRMLNRLEELVPGLPNALTSCEVGSPLSNQHYVSATAGNLYGTAKTRGQVGPLAFPLKTPLNGLWMCGASTLAHGVVGGGPSRASPLRS